VLSANFPHLHSLSIFSLVAFAASLRSEARPSSVIIWLSRRRSESTEPLGTNLQHYPSRSDLMWRTIRASRYWQWVGIWTLKVGGRACVVANVGVVKTRFWRDRGVDRVVFAMAGAGERLVANQAVPLGE
jgi:hypothetical protein